MDSSYSNLVSDFDYERMDESQVTVMTGQTPKPLEIPFGSLKQLVTTYQTADYLEEQGYDANVLFVNADSFVPEQRRNPDAFKQMTEGFSENYGSLEHVKTSELNCEREREEVIDRLQESFPTEAAYTNDYSLDEVATIAAINQNEEGALVKIGPPQERPYDGIFSDAFPESSFAGVYLTPTVPLERGMNQEQLEDMEQEGGVIPYHNYGSRIQLSDGEEEIQEKRKDATERTERDIESVKAFLDQKEGEKPLGQHFDNLMQRDRVSRPVARSMFEHG